MKNSRKDSVLRKNSGHLSRRVFLSQGMKVAAGAAALGSAGDSAADPKFVKHQVEPNEEGTLRVAACQILCYPEVKRSAAKVLQWIEKAAKDNVDVVAFPEACLCGYADGDYWKTARPEEFINAERRIVQAAKEHNIGVVLGTVHWEGEKIYNDLLVIDKGGIVRGRYSKTHLAEPWSTSGKALPIYSVAGVQSCFVICHDIRYPEVVRLPAIAGAQICYFCSHESDLTYEVKLSAYRAMPIARATENTIFCIMSNAPTDRKSFHGSHGNSKIIHPDGNVLVEAGYFEERLVATNLRIADATRNIALRAANDDTILKNWLRQGVSLVEKSP